MALTGKGMWIWQLPRCENGDPEKIAAAAQSANFTHVIIKVANGMLAYNVNPTTKRDLVPQVAEALRSRGIEVWGWHYIYGYNPAAEANIAIQRIKQLHLDGYVIDAEQEYKQPGMAAKASTFMKQLRSAVPQNPIALSSYRYPKYHPELPWKEFLELCDYNMPQVYWEQAHNPAAQLDRCVSQFNAVAPYRPIIPTGAMYKTGGWVPSTADTTDFLHAAHTMNMHAVNFYVWDHRPYLQPQWNSLASFNWDQSVVPVDVSDRLFQALNSHDSQQVSSLYDEKAVLITTQHTIQGTSSLQAYYKNLFNDVLKNGKFSITSFKSNGNTRHITWTAVSDQYKIENGSDTLGTKEGKIIYHYSFFKQG